MLLQQRDGCGLKGDRCWSVVSFISFKNLSEIMSRVVVLEKHALIKKTASTKRNNSKMVTVMINMLIVNGGAGGCCKSVEVL